MRRAAVGILAAVVMTGAHVLPAAAAGARRALDEGLDLFAAGRYDEAATRFAGAAEQAGGEGLDPAVGGYDRAIAFLKAGRAPEAAAAFAELEDAGDERLRESARYQRGIALETAADATESGGDLPKAIALLDEALAAYEGAMRVDPGDEDPKVNHELAFRKRARLAQKLQGQGASRPPERAGRGEPPPERPPRPEPSGKEMRPEEARTLLDALRQQEQSQRGRMRPFRGDATAVEKDW
ncbi:MAG TPA: hypothetical protein VI078_12690 [bacterium]